MRYSQVPTPWPGWRNWQTQRTQNPPTFGSWGFDPPSRHQQNKEFKLNWPLKIREAKRLLVLTVVSIGKNKARKEDLSNLAERIALIWSDPVNPAESVGLFL